MVVVCVNCDGFSLQQDIRLSPLPFFPPVDFISMILYSLLPTASPFQDAFLAPQIHDCNLWINKLGPGCLNLPSSALRGPEHLQVSAEPDRGLPESAHIPGIGQVPASPTGHSQELRRRRNASDFRVGCVSSLFHLPRCISARFKLQQPRYAARKRQYEAEEGADRMSQMPYPQTQMFGPNAPLAPGDIR